MPPMARRQARRKRGRAPFPPHRVPRLKPTHLNAAGIDVGATQPWVAVPADLHAQPVRPFGAFTADLYALAEWLRPCGIDTVALESTGVYWIPLFEVLEERGFEVRLVDPHLVKQIPGRKTDVHDCQWRQELHRSDWLRGRFDRWSRGVRGAVICGSGAC
jgi:transposase